MHQSYAAKNYEQMYSQMDQQESKELLERAQEYNEQLAETGIIWDLSEDQETDYYTQLKLPETDVMGTLEIPRINCYLPIYHGTDPSVLQAGIGHLESTSLPIGGEGTHCALSGHRGLPSSKLLTDLSELKIGDTFLITVLGQTITYEVDSIKTVEPEAVGEISIEEGKDYCTLITCTPYGVNTHRLLVRGVRVDNAPSVLHVQSEAFEMDPIRTAPFVAIPLLAGLLVIILVKYRKRKEDSHEKSESS